jgi:protein-disulfide isomerase
VQTDVDLQVERLVLRGHHRRRRRAANLLAALLVAAAALTGAELGLSIGTTATPPTHVPAGLTADQTGFVVAHGPVKLDIYLDYLCPECKTIESQISPLLQRLEVAGTVQLVYHPIGFLDSYSSPAGYSSRAAAAAACASDAGKFAAYTTVLYSEQPAERGPGLSVAALIAAGRSAGIIDPAFSSCVQSGKYAAWVTYASNIAFSKNVAVTPTVLVNGSPIDLTGANPAQTLAGAVAAATSS